MAVNVEAKPWIHELPAYSPVTETPDYTAEPRPDEERIQINRRLIREESGVFVTQNKQITVALTNQSVDCTEPTYGRGATVQGMVTLAKTEGVISVIVKLLGEMEFALASLIVSGSTVIPIMDDHVVLYRKTESPTHSESKLSTFRKRSSSQPITSLIPPNLSAEKCPSSLTFAIRLPGVYTHAGITRPLPPSYSARFGDGIPVLKILGLSVECSYILQITVVRKGSLVDKKAILTVPIIHLPRSRPQRPPLSHSLTFLSTIKSSPEEWKLFESEAKVRIDEVSCPTFSAGLLLPESQVYTLGQPIPFHLQLSSTSTATLAPFASLTSFSDPPSIKAKEPINPRNSLAGAGMIGKRGTSAMDEATVKQVSTSILSKQLFQSNTPPRIHLSVQRHVTVEVMGQWVQFKECLSRAVLESCPVNNVTDSVQDGEMANIAWEGHLEIQERHRCSGFLGPSIRVRDFVWLSVKPPNPEQAPLQGIHLLIPIRLTTDPYGEEIISGMELVQGPPATGV